MKFIWYYIRFFVPSQPKMNKMKKSVLFLIALMLLLNGCTNTYNQLIKTQDNDLKYESAKQLFAMGKYQKAAYLLDQTVTFNKGSDRGPENLYMIAMAQYNMADYTTAAEYFRKYATSYPKGSFAELARYYYAKSLCLSTPEPRLDQTETVAAMKAYQEYLDIYPDAKFKETAQNEMFMLQDKLVKKEYLNAKLYYNMGGYFGNCTSGGNNYESCIITAQNALKDYPYTELREDFYLLIMKSKYELAQQSVEEKKMDRFRDAEDECYGFINEFPDSKNVALAEKYIAQCKKYIKD